MSPAASLTTLTLFSLKDGYWRWGLAQMGTMPPKLKNIPGLKFFKLLGSGKGQVFSLMPDFYLYGLLAEWESDTAAQEFFRSPVYQEYIAHCKETWTVNLKSIKSHGLWDGQSPFKPDEHNKTTKDQIAILTRASLRIKTLPAFWKNAVGASKAIEKAEGLIAAVGLGELPFIRQATFSIWENEELMKQYAYKTAQHQEVIKRTRQQNWYSEELFARFAIISSKGTWKGQNPLEINKPEINPII